MLVVSALDNAPTPGATVPVVPADPVTHQLSGSVLLGTSVGDVTNAGVATVEERRVLRVRPMGESDGDAGWVMSRGSDRDAPSDSDSIIRDVKGNGTALAVVYDDGLIAVRSADDGAPLWAATVGTQFDSAEVLVVGDDASTVVVGAADVHTWWFLHRNGTSEQLSASADCRRLSAEVADDGVVVLIDGLCATTAGTGSASDDAPTVAQIRAVDSATGSVRWRATMTALTSDPMVGADGSVRALAADGQLTMISATGQVSSATLDLPGDGELALEDVTDGDLLVSADTDFPQTSQPVPLSLSRVASDGTIRFTFDGPIGFRQLYDAQVIDGRVYAVGAVPPRNEATSLRPDTWLVVFDWSSGQELSRQQVGTDIAVVSGSRNGHLIVTDTEAVNVYS